MTLDVLSHPHGLELRQSEDGTRCNSRVFEDVDELLAEARAKRAQAEAFGWIGVEGDHW